MVENKRYGTSAGQTQEECVLSLVREKGILRTQDLSKVGIPRIVLTRMCRSGQLNRLGRGLYALPDTEITENHSLAEVAKRIPHATVCLLSALRFHGLTTQTPFEVWVAIDVKARKPNVKDMPLRVVRFSGKARTHGVEEHDIEGVTVPVTSPAKTVADCFKYRNKIGIDVATEALKDYQRSRKGSMDDLWVAAGICRVQTVIRPYIEMMQ